jgi:hypothetical protein
LKAPLFLRIFCIFGLSYAVLRALRALAEGEPASRAIGLSTVAGIVVGLAMAFILPAMNSVGLKLRGFDPDTDGVDVDVRRTVEVPLPPEQALARCREALERMRAKRMRVDPASATVEGRGRISWASFGEEVLCRVEPAGGGSRVEIRSRPVLRTTLMDCGKNLENVERIRAALVQAA